MKDRFRGALCWLVGAGLFLATLAPTQISAQPGPSPDDPIETVPSEAATPPPPPALDEAWGRYHSAFVAYVNGDIEQCRQTLQRIIAEYPNHPAAGRAHSVLQSIDLRPAEISPTPPPLAVDEKSGTPVGEAEEKSNLARAELVSFQTLHGIGIGAEICIFVSCQDGRAIAGTLTLTGGAGLGISLLASRNGVKPGMTLAVNSGTLWGFYDGLLIVGLTQTSETKAVIGAALAGQSLGLMTGIVTHILLEPTVGQVSTVNSGMLWSNVVALWLLGMNGFDVDQAVIWGTLLAATQVGLVGGALVAANYPMSRGRTLLIDAGGVVGSLLGLAVPLLITNGEGPSAAIATSGLVGTLGGLAAGTYLTRNWDAPDFAEKHALRLQVSPNFDVTGATVSLAGSF